MFKSEKNPSLFSVTHELYHVSLFILNQPTKGAEDVVVGMSSNLAEFLYN